MLNHIQSFLKQPVQISSPVHKYFLRKLGLHKQIGEIGQYHLEEKNGKEYNKTWICFGVGTESYTSCMTPTPHWSSLPVLSYPSLQGCATYIGF